MGCASSTSGQIPGTDMDDSAPNVDDDDSAFQDDDDIMITVEDAVEYTEMELGISHDRAWELVQTVDQNSDGNLSSSELVLLNEKIKEVKQRLVPRFKHYDHDNTGFVEPTDAVAILTQEFEGLPYPCIIAMVNRFDKDCNNMVDFSEFIEFYSCVKAKKTMLEKKFDDLDEDASGDLDAEELVHTLMKECALKELQARSLVDDFDLNKDGKLDRNEFNHMWTKLFG